MNKIRRFVLYLIRWQLSTPILAVVMSLFGTGEDINWAGAIVSNLVGGCIFYWVDKIIFKK